MLIGVAHVDSPCSTCLQVLEKSGEKEEALEIFNRAYEIAPDSPMVGFRRAKALVSLGKIQVRFVLSLSFAMVPL